MRSSFRVLCAIVAASCLCTPFAGRAAEKDKARLRHSTNPLDAAKCQRQLNLIYGALQQYQLRKRELPPWLSELTPDFLSDPNALVCPFVQESGYYEDWKKEFVTVPVFGDPGQCIYGYEFCLEPFRYVPGWTTRHYKQRQMELIGFGVPIVRCFAHRPVLNLGYDGSIYPSPGEWEDNFVISEAYKRALHAVLKLARSSPNEMAMSVITPRSPDADPRRIDLSKHYNASLLHLTQVDQTGHLLQMYPEELLTVGDVVFEVRGLVHLTARNFPINFPQSIENIVIDRKCKVIHFLHGAIFPAARGATICNYVVHCGNGSNAFRIPVTYGKDVKTRWVDARQKAELNNPPVAWVSPTDRVGPTGQAMRLYQLSWTNRAPDSIVRSIDLASSMSDSAPFLVAITVE